LPDADGFWFHALSGGRAENRSLIGQLRTIETLNCLPKSGRSADSDSVLAAIIVIW
jgi:hypothetical protein